MSAPRAVAARAATTFNALAGTISVFLAFNRMAMLKLPDFHLEKYGTINGTTPFLHGGSTFSFHRGFAFVWAIGMAGGF